MLKVASCGWMIILGFCTTPIAQGQDFLLLPDSSARDRILRLNATTGAVEGTFLSSSLFQTPIQALYTPNNTIVVSDQLADAIFEYGIDGTFIRTVANGTQGLDNIRGMAIRGQDLYVNVGSNSLSTSNTVQRFNLQSLSQSTFINTNIDSPWGIHFRGSDLLVSNSGTDNIERFDATTGAHLGTLVSGPDSGLNFPQQIFERENGNLLVAGFSLPSAIYEFTATGSFVRTLADGLGQRGVYELANGLFLFSAGTAIRTVDPANGDIQVILNDTASPAASFRFISPVTLVSVPEPATDLLVVLAGVGLFWIKRWQRMASLLPCSGD